MIRSVTLRLGMALGFVAICAAGGRAQVTVTPSTLNYSNVATGLFATRVVTVLNTGFSPVTVSGMTFSSPAFGLADGVFPKGLGQNQSYPFSIAFKPSLAQAYSATLTVDLANGQQLPVQLNGTGIVNTGIPSVSTSSINFGSLPLGSSAIRNVTVSNTGTQSFQVTAITSYQPFTISRFSGPVTLGVGQSMTVGVSYSANNLGAVAGNVTISYDTHPSSGVDLTGTGSQPSGIAITSFPTLPTATQRAVYQATMQLTGGTAPYYWSLRSGNVKGLTFSSAGVFTGTVASTVPPGNYPFTVHVTDSSGPPKNVSAVVTIPVGPPSPANCNDIDIDVTGSSNPVIALNDLGTGTYQGYEGGLYPDGSNVDPAAHQSSAVTIAQGIQPLDSNGNPDPNGTYVLMSFGPSTTEQPFVDFINAANADPQKNSHLTIVNGALGGETASLLAILNGGYPDTILNYVLPFAGVTPQQVVVAWVDAIDSTAAAFPGNAQTLQSELETTAQNLHILFPNLVLAYFGSLNYTGYSNGVSTLDPEPQGYETAWGDKWAIQDQIDGNANLNWDPKIGPVLAPWMGWGPYYWANGLLARSDGTYWSCQDMKPDGLHPTYPGGNLKVTSNLLSFFKTDTSASIWYLTPPPNRPKR